MLSVCILICTVLALSSVIVFATITTQDKEEALQKSEDIKPEDLKELFKIAKEVTKKSQEAKILLSLTTENKEQKEQKENFLKDSVKDGFKPLINTVKGIVQPIISAATTIGLVLIMLRYREAVLKFVFGEYKDTYYPYSPSPKDYASPNILKDYCYLDSNGKANCYPDLCENAWKWPFGPADCPK
jgi:predicted PurR-regulated permease PerM